MNDLVQGGVGIIHRASSGSKSVNNLGGSGLLLYVGH